MLRRFTLVALLATVAAVAGCGADKDEPVTRAETEGIYIDVGELTYQVQLSRYINPADTEDRYYLLGLPEGTQPLAPDETWFGVWIRIQNETGEPQEPADTFEIVDTQEDVFRPVELDPLANSFGYQPVALEPGTIVPLPDSAAGNGPVQGSLLLFRVTFESLQNRPLEFRISHGGREPVGVVDLDV